MEKKAAKKVARKLDAIGWSLFFIWLGVVMITDARTGVSLLGIGAIILGVQATRRYFQMKMETFWTIVGLLFLSGGLWEMYELNAPFGAFILISFGVLIMVSTLRKERSERKVEGVEPPQTAPKGEGSPEHNK